MSAPTADIVLKGGFKEGLVKAGTAIKNAVLWLGRMIKIGFEKSVEAIKHAWSVVAPFIRDAAVKVWEFVKIPLVQVLGFAALGTIFGVVAETVNNKKHVALALRVTAAACFVAAGIGIGLGIGFGFLKPVGS